MRYCYYEKDTKRIYGYYKSIQEEFDDDYIIISDDKFNSLMDITKVYVKDDLSDIEERIEIKGEN